MNTEEDFKMVGPNSIRALSKDSFMSTESDENSELFSPSSCNSGIDRFEMGSSNSEDTWTKAKAGKLWKDPEFGAHDLSLNWAKHGYGKIECTPPEGLEWKRP